MECIFYSSTVPQALFHSAQDTVYSIAAKTARILMLDGGRPLNGWAAAATKEHEWAVGRGFYPTSDVNSETWTEDGNDCIGIKDQLRGAGYVAVNESPYWSLAFFPYRENKTNTNKTERKSTAVTENAAFGFHPDCYRQPGH